MQKLAPGLSAFAEVEQARLLHRNAPFSLVALGLAAIVLAYALRDAVPQIQLYSWLSLYLAVSAIRGVGVWLYANKNYLLSRPLSWSRAFAIGATISGFIWGAAAIAFFRPDDPGLVVLLTGLLVAVVAAAAQALSPYLPSFIGFVLPTILPLLWMLGTVGGGYFSTLGALGFFYLIAISGFAYNSRRLIRESILLRFKNMELIDRLSVEKSAAEHNRRVAEQATIAKSKFLAAASHDLRQPLHALGFFQDALETHVPEAGRRIMEQMRQSIAALGGLFDSLLDISRLDAGVVEAKPKHIPLENIVRSIEEEYRPRAAEKSLDFKCESGELTVYADPVMLERTIRNLVSNAVRYTDTGSVTLLSRVDDDDVFIDVIDTGRGIDESEFDNIFSEYHQLHNPERDRTKGLGLGLSIVRRLCKLMKADISVRSEQGRGSTFTLQLPKGDPAAVGTKTRPRSRWDLSGAVVVVIDDEADILESMGGVMERWGCKPILAGSVGEALEQIRAKSQRPTAIIADYRLRKGETGIAAIRVIREDAGEPIPALLVSGDTAPDRLQEVKDSGLRLLNKPVTPAELRIALFQEISNPPA